MSSKLGLSSVSFIPNYRSGQVLGTLLDPSLATPTRLRELVIGLHTRAGLLLSPYSRACLMDLLRLKEADALATVLRILPDRDVYSSLKNFRVRNGSEREQILFDFFELSLPILEPVVPAPSMSVGVVEYGLFPHQRVAARKIRTHRNRNLRRFAHANRFGKNPNCNEHTCGSLADRRAILS
jgi:DNA repair protein RadD